MAWPSSLSVALKEWAAVCSALEHGRQIILLRKGGIYEAAGEFELENRQFILFPTYLHQKRALVKTPDQPLVHEAAAEPGEIVLSSAAVVTDILQLKSRRQMDALDAHHIWAPPLLDMRFSYRPENPLYLLLVRAFRLHQPQAIPNTPLFAGCKSWVPFDQPLPTADALPALDDLRYESERNNILTKLASIQITE
jgi:hypothetical protein